MADALGTTPAPPAAADAEPDIYTSTLGDQPLNVDAWIPESLQSYWELINQFPVIGGAIIAMLFFGIALFVRVILLNGLQRLASKTESALDNTIIALLRKPIFATVFGLGLYIAVLVARLPFGGSFVINVIATYVVVTWMLAGLKISTAILDNLAQVDRANIIEARTIPLFDLVSKLIILLLASYVMLMIWGINPVGWLASAGIVGIAVGFAAKDTLANLFSGLFIVADAPYKMGDYINLDSGERGMVTRIGMRSTRMLTRGDVEVTVPNAVIANAKITNESGGPFEKMRIRIQVGAAYGSDVDQVCEVLQATGDAHPQTCTHPSPRVRLRTFGASSLDFELLCWIDKPANRGRISHELNMAVYKAFAQANIEIPYSKHDLYIKSLPDGAGS